MWYLSIMKSCIVLGLKSTLVVFTKVVGKTIQVSDSDTLEDFKCFRPGSV